ncbi:hypothetical protein CC80DRAFT_424548, partial [Byssothecium circinans]
GPYKCKRINLTIGKPCNTIFLRLYNLTRYEDTIYNVRKQKVHYVFCTKEKTFLRNNVLIYYMVRVYY